MSTGDKRREKNKTTDQNRIEKKSQLASEIKSDFENYWSWKACNNLLRRNRVGGGGVFGKEENEIDTRIHKAKKKVSLKSWEVKHRTRKKGKKNEK